MGYISSKGANGAPPAPIDVNVLNDDESLNITWFCDTDGVITGGTAYVRDIDGILTPEHFDATGQPTATAPTGVPCQPKDYEYKSSTFCFEDVDGLRYTKEFCRSWIDGVAQPDVEFWHLPDGTTATAQPAGLLPCQDSKTEVSDGIDIPNSSAAFTIPVARVNNFTVSADGQLNGDFSPVIITTPSGTVTMHVPGTRTFGSDEPLRALDTIGYSIATGPDSNADIHWDI